MINFFFSNEYATNKMPFFFVIIIDCKVNI